MTLAERLLAAYVGSDAAYGETTVGRIGRKGKAEANSFVRRGKMTVQQVQDHIDGKQGIGAIPINSENMCMFGALDIDVYDLDHAGLQKKIQQLKLPLFHCRTKSGGAHLYLFLDTWHPASLVREYLMEMSIALGFSGCEIFPKQDSILVERGDLGNFINMPYFDADQTTRYCFSRKSEAMDLEEFLDAVEKGRVSRIELDALDLTGSKEHFTDGPPCLRILVATGTVGDMRNNTLLQMGVYAKMKYPDTWEKVVEDYNRKFMSPNLEAKEVLGIIKQLQKKDYFYTCNVEPFCSVCDKDMCRTKKYGVGGDSESKAQVGGLTVILSQPRYYFMDVNGKRVELTIDELHNQSLWQKACLMQINFMPSTMKAPDWTSLVNKMLKQATFIEVSKELTLEGRFEDLLKSFCNGSAQAYDPAELETGKPYHESGRVKFKIDGLVNFLKNRQHPWAENRAKIQEEIKRLNSMDEFSGRQRYKKSDGSWGTIRVWWVPEFEEEDIDLPIQEIDTNVPF
jgi:hypothetical protein